MKTEALKSIPACLLAGKDTASAQMRIVLSMLHLFKENHSGDTEEGNMMRIGAVLAAAGLSSRMEEYKPMLPFGGSTIAGHIVGVLKGMGIRPVIVVTGYRAEELERHLSHAGVRFVRNERYKETEMFDSIKLGLTEAAADCDKIMLMPIDTPAIKPETIRRVMAVDAEVVRTMCKGEPGHPVLLSAGAVKAVCAYNGTRGLRGAIEETGLSITNLEVEDEGIYRDVDTPEEYLELLQWNYGRGEVYPVRPFVQVGLEAGERFFGPGVCGLLELIDQTGSIQEACLKMELSYSKGSRMIKAIDRQLGFPAVQRWTGGSGGGGSVLTEKGRQLVKNYRDMVREIEGYTEKAFQEFFQNNFHLCG